MAIFKQIFFVRQALINYRVIQYHLADGFHVGVLVQRDDFGPNKAT